jgi:hypothetical protein
MKIAETVYNSKLSRTDIFYFYQILTFSNKLKIFCQSMKMSPIVVKNKIKQNQCIFETITGFLLKSGVVYWTVMLSCIKHYHHFLIIIFLLNHLLYCIFDIYKENYPSGVYFPDKVWHQFWTSWHIHYH